MRRSIYNEYASLYDRSGQNRFSQKMVLYSRSIWSSLGLKPRTLLDLACGTGTAALLFAKTGIEVSGLDLSREMLARARKKRGSKAVRWFEGDMRCLKLGRRFDAVTCFYDSLNYLMTPGDLKKTFQGVAAHLEAGGLFIFDLATEHALAREWGNSTEALPSNDLFQIWRSRYDPKERIASLELTLFKREGSSYHRIDETHHHRAIPPLEVSEALEEAGFRLEGVYACFTQEPPLADTYRVAYVARRRAIQVGD